MPPDLLQEQLEQIDKIHDKYNDERAELTNRLKVIMVEASEADTDGEPDYAAIERNIEEVAEIRVQLAKLRLQIHREIRPLLDDDQKVLFDRSLAAQGPRKMARSTRLRFDFSQRLARTEYPLEKTDSARQSRLLAIEVVAEAGSASDRCFLCK